MHFICIFIFSYGQCFGIFFLLHCVLVPTTKTFEIIDVKRISMRYSIRDSPQNFIITGSRVAACETETLKKYESNIHY